MHTYIPYAASKSLPGTVELIATESSRLLSLVASFENKILLSQSLYKTVGHRVTAGEQISKHNPPSNIYAN